MNNQKEVTTDIWAPETPVAGWSPEPAVDIWAPEVEPVKEEIPTAVKAPAQPVAQKTAPAVPQKQELNTLNKPKTLPAPLSSVGRGFSAADTMELDDAGKEAFVNTVKAKEQHEYAKHHNANPIAMGLVNAANVPYAQQKEYLKKVGSHPVASHTEKLMSPFAKGSTAFEEGKGAVESGVSAIKAFGKGIGEYFQDKTDYEPITSDELESAGVITKDPQTGKWKLDIKKAIRTYAPTNELIRANVMNLMQATGRAEDPDTAERVMKAIKLRGDLADVSEAGGLKKIISVLDVATFGVGSAAAVNYRLAQSGVLLRPPEFRQMDESTQKAAQAQIAKAQQAKGPITWKSPMGEMTVYPDSTLDTIEDMAFAKQMDDKLGDIAEMTQSGFSKDVGNVAQQVAEALLAPETYLLRAANKIPGVSKALQAAIRKMPKTAASAGWVSRLLTNMGIAGGSTYVGALGSDEAKRKKALMSAAATGVFQTGIDVGVVGMKTGKKAVGKLLEKVDDIRAQRDVKILQRTEEYSQLPKHLQNKIHPDEFSEVRKIIEEHGETSAHVRDILDDYSAKTGINARAQEGFAQVLNDPTNPHGKQIISDLNKAENSHSGRTLEEARVESAFMSTLANPNTATKVKDIEAPLGAAKTKADVKPGRKAEVNQLDSPDLQRHGYLLDKYRDLFGAPDKLIAVLEREHPEFANAFKQRLGSSIFSPAEFAYNRAQILLNSTLRVNKDTIHDTSRAWGGKQPTLGTIAERVNYPAQEAAHIQFQNLGAEVQKNQQISMARAAQIGTKIEAALNQPRPTTDIGSVSPEVSEYLRAFAKDVKNGDAVSNIYKERATEAFAAVTQDPLAAKKFKKNITAYQEAEFRHGRAVNALSEAISVRDNLNPNEFMRRRAKFVNSNPDRYVQRIMNNFDNPTDNMRYITESLFKDWQIDPNLQKHIETAVTDKMPGWESLQTELDALEAAYIGMKDTLSKNQKGALATTINTLKSYERDITKYHAGMDALYDKNVTIDLSLAVVRNQLDQVKNPRIAAELKKQLDQARPEYFQEMTNLRANLSEAEQVALWDYLSGDAFVRLKQGSMRFDILNANTTSSMMKSLNLLGRDTIDAYSQVYEIAHGQKLDKDIFHAFFCTPSNGFDENNMFMSANFTKAINEKKEAMDRAKSTLSRGLIAFRSYDEMEAKLARVLQRSPGPIFSYFVNDTRRAKGEIADFLNLSGITAGKGLMDEIVESPWYSEMENPTLVNMIKKHFVVAGYEEGMNIANFLPDGSYELTDFGKFADMVFNDKNLTSTLYKLAQGETTVLDASGLAVHLNKDAMLVPLAQIAESRGLVKAEPNLPNGSLPKSIAWANYMLNYWNFFHDADAAIMWNHMKNFGAFYSKLDAHLLGRDVDITAKNNRIYSAFKGGAKLIPKVHRKHRMNNQLMYQDNNIYNHPFGAGYSELRINNMFGTSERAIVEYGKGISVADVKHPLDNVYSKVWQSLMSSHTAHARSGLEVYAIGAKQIGFDHDADWIARTGELLTAEDVQIENARLSTWINALREVDKVRVLPQAIVAANAAINVTVRPFGSMLSWANLKKNNAQAAIYAFTVGDKSLKKFVTTMMSPYKIVFMTPFYTDTGKARFKFLEKMMIDDPKVWEIGDEVLKGYRDVQYRESVGNAMQLAKLGKVSGVSLANAPKPYTDKFWDKMFTKTENGIQFVSGKYVDNMDQFNDWVARNTKERSEFYHIRSTMNQGQVVGQKVIAALQNGDRENAYKLIANCFVDKPASIAEWHLQNFESAIRKGDGTEALRGFLPAYIDQNTGRFGRIAQPEFVQAVAKLVPGVGLFYAARNMWAWKILQAASNIRDPNSRERAKFILMAGEMAIGAAIVSSAYKWMFNGLSTPVSDAIMSDEEKKSIADNGDGFDVKNAVLRTVMNGLVHGVNAEDYTGFKFPWSLDFKYGDDVTEQKWSEAGTVEKLGMLSPDVSSEMDIYYGVNLGLELLGFGGPKGKGPSASYKMPLLGYALERGIPVVQQLHETFKLHTETPEQYKADQIQAIAYEYLQEQDAAKLLNEWKLNKHDQTVINKIHSLHEAKKKMSYAKSLDAVMSQGPVGFTTNWMKDGFSTLAMFYHIQDSLGLGGTKTTLQDTMTRMEQIGMSVTGKQASEDPRYQTPGKRPANVVAPWEHADELSPFGNSDMSREIYEFIGADKWFMGGTEYERFRSFLDNASALYVKNKVWQSKDIEAFKQSAMKQYDILHGVTRRQAELENIQKKKPVLPLDEATRKAMGNKAFIEGLTK
jgi:hypothetical protein